MKKILVIAPHPDDETLGCGGTLSRHQDKGDELYWIIVTCISEDMGWPESAVKKRDADIDAAAKKLGLKDSQVMLNIDRLANTTSATLPICISEATKNNLLNIGDNVLLSTFGAGFSWGATYIKWGMPTYD